MHPSPPATESHLRELFDEPAPLTVGLEEEVMVLDGASLDLAPRGAELIEAAGESAPFKLEMPAAQLEIATAPHERLDDALAELGAGRRALAALAGEHGLSVATGGAHPFAAPEGPLNRGERYEEIERRYATAARRQLVFALQVHVCLRGAERVLAVHNALRGHLPELAALAASAPFHDGRDTGLASIRPLVCTLLPRQGVPPALASWEELAAGLEWAGDPGAWWWEMRPHRIHGTLELRVPDAQPRLRDAGAVVATAVALVVRLAERFDAGEPLGSPATWRIGENRWSALRHGVEGEMIDLDTGARTSTRDRLEALLDDLDPVAERLGFADRLADARALLAAGGSAGRIRAASAGEPRRAAEWLEQAYLEVCPG